MCYVLFSYACILIGQGFICWYIFIVIYSFVSPFREAKFCGVPSCGFDKLGCAAGEKYLRNTDVEYTFIFVIYPLKYQIKIQNIYFVWFTVTDFTIQYIYTILLHKLWPSELLSTSDWWVANRSLNNTVLDAFICPVPSMGRGFSPYHFCCCFCNFRENAKCAGSVPLVACRMSFNFMCLESNYLPQTSSFVTVWNLFETWSQVKQCCARVRVSYTKILCRILPVPAVHFSCTVRLYVVIGTHSSDVMH
jgi:hypothetical protein